ncbi:hypothetical protein [Saccharothrix syringae]|nr:hypothetical protein [Saccharothrix syringae]
MTILGEPDFDPTRVPPGVVRTTFHHPVTGAGVVTTEDSDCAAVDR